MLKVLLTTVFTGFNYGSSLQALAGKTLLKNLGYDCDLVGLKSLVPGRDVRVNKIIKMFFRSIVIKRSKIAAGRKTEAQKKFIGDTCSKFLKFIDENVSPTYYSWRKLKTLSKSSIACFAGSDQIWNSSIIYIDPLYYMRFAPENKRIALAPSFGRDYIADYNVNKIKKWISEVPFLSVREDTGVKLINELTGRDAVQLVDPTLMLNAAEWENCLNIESDQNDYILAYFLDTPTERAKKAIKDLKAKLGYEIIAIPYMFDDMSYCDKTMVAGPLEFLKLIKNAKVVCTDSFHGTAFSINFHTPFFVFDRNYGTVASQSSRVTSILRKVNMLDRFDIDDPCSIIYTADFEYSEAVLNEERNKAYAYIQNAINKIQNHEK